MITKLQCELQVSDTKRTLYKNKNVRKRISKTEEMQKRKGKMMIRQITAERQLGHQRYFQIVRT